ncbi:uncharacterized protein PG998_004889 [Apiospora kogelbergensis]|uniref:Uncharacterized protein n=1 Tax=Apiospora kogelbergensis TaxID=1337665 RepID=A0AAW0QF84_9PEZI
MQDDQSGWPSSPASPPPASIFSRNKKADVLGSGSSHRSHPSGTHANLNNNSSSSNNTDDWTLTSKSKRVASSSSSSGPANAHAAEELDLPRHRPRAIGLPIFFAAVFALLFALFLPPGTCTTKAS